MNVKIRFRHVRILYKEKDLKVFLVKSDFDKYIIPEGSGTELGEILGSNSDLRAELLKDALADCMSNAFLIFLHSCLINDFISDWQMTNGTFPKAYFALLYSLSVTLLSHIVLLFAELVLAAM